MFKKKKQSSIDTLIDESMNIRGSMTFSGGIRIDGKLHGNLSLAEGSSGSVILGKNSYIHGNIKTESAIIAGKIKGSIEASDFLELHETAIIDGDLSYKIIEIHAGAKIDGNLSEIKNKPVKIKNIDKETKK